MGIAVRIRYRINTTRFTLSRDTHLAFILVNPFMPAGQKNDLTILAMPFLNHSKGQRSKDFLEIIETLSFGIYWMALTEYFQMSTDLLSARIYPP